MSVRALVLSEHAFAAMEEDCLTHQETETGGVLVGKWIGEQLVVPFVVLGGPGAHRSWGGFAPDPNWQQRYLDYLFGRFGVDYAGDYHRHPNRFDRPSGTDLKTCRHIVTDPEWGVPEAVFPILTLAEYTVHMRAFALRRGSKNFEEIPHTIVPDRDPRIQEALLGPLDKEIDYEDALDCPSRSDRGRRRVRRWLGRLRPCAGI